MNQFISQSLATLTDNILNLTKQNHLTAFRGCSLLFGQTRIAPLDGHWATFGCGVVCQLHWLLRKSNAMFLFRLWNSSISIHFWNFWRWLQVFDAIDAFFKFVWRRFEGLFLLGPILGIHSAIFILQRITVVAALDDHAILSTYKGISKILVK